MQEVLYVVNTRRDPIFLDPIFKIDYRKEAMDMQMAFILEVRKQYSRFGFPYLALLHGGDLYLPKDIYGGLVGGVEKGMILNGGEHGEPCTLDKFIEMFKFGEVIVENGKRKPISAVVEFSAIELYPDVMKILKPKYEIKRIQVD